MHTSLILYAEHEFNASTFTCRVIAGTGSDMYSAISGGIGALRGPKHGGANEVAFEVQKRYETPNEAEADIRARVENKEVVIGFGHPVYTISDPRNKVIKDVAVRLSKKAGTTKMFDIADRIEAGTFLCAVAATGGDVLLRHGRADHLDAVIEKLQAAGAKVMAVDGGIRIQSSGRLKAQNFRTTEYPGFPTDMQAQFMALNSISHGASKVTETIFENRFMHVNELVRLGAQIQIEGKVSLVEGVAKLSGATVMATDLRASASLVIAGLVAEGETMVDRIYHLDRGYDQMETKLRALGADIERIR
jgi:hypothetical protein